ncbi:MAG: TauD/TfdA dioxygenase family protein, partial [Lysobacterales bacterium]
MRFAIAPCIPPWSERSRDRAQPAVTDIRYFAFECVSEIIRLLLAKSKNLVTMLTIKIANAALGATVEDLDLTAPLQEADIAELKVALAEYQVLFFRDQDISYRNHRDFGTSFGTLQIHPSYPAIDGYPEILILENDRENPSKIDQWHTDMSFRPVPPLGSILVGRVVPENRGATMFANLAAAFEDLPGSLKKSLEGMTATHSFAYGFKD